MSEEITFLGKSKKLNKTAREELLNLLISNAFGEKFKKLKEFEKTFADKLYKEFTLKPYEKFFETLDDEWFFEDDNIYVSIPGSYRYKRRFYFGIGEDGNHMEKKFPRVSNRTDEIIFENDLGNHPLKGEFEKFTQKKEKLKEEKSSVRTKTRAALSNINTTKQLFELWPEAYKAYLEMCVTEKDTIVYLPDIPRNDLNNMLGL